MLVLYGGLFYVLYLVKTRQGLGAWLVKHQASKEIKFIESKGIAPRTSVALIEVRGQPLVVVIAPNAVSVHPLHPGNDSKSSSTSNKTFEESLELATKK